MHYYQHHIGDFLAATAMMTKWEAMTYLQMIWRYYDTEQPLPDDPKRIARQVQSDVPTVEFILDEKFEYAHGVWRNARCDREIRAYHDKSAKSRKAAESRWHGQKITNSSPNGADMDAGAMRTHSGRNADTMRADSGRNADGMPTINHEPVTKERGGTAARFQRPTVEQVKAFIDEKGYHRVDPNVFVDHYETVGWRVGKNPMKEWRTAVANWHRREADKNPEPTTRSRKKL